VPVGARKVVGDAPEVGLDFYHSIYSGQQVGVIRIRTVDADQARERGELLLDIGNETEEVLRETLDFELAGVQQSHGAVQRSRVLQYRFDSNQLQTAAADSGRLEPTDISTRFNLRRRQSEFDGKYQFPVLMTVPIVLTECRHPGG
jgi:hypothetical protein